MVPSLKIARYRFNLKVRTPLSLEAFAGSTLRGAFGNIFKKRVCVWPPGDCPRCSLRHQCAYARVFETAPPPNTTKLRGIDQIPRPFVFEPPLTCKDPYRLGDQLEFRLVLIGTSTNHLAHFIHSFIELGHKGLGPNRGQFDVAEVWSELGQAPALVYRRVQPLPVEGNAGLLEGNGLIQLRAVPAGVRLKVNFATPTRIRTENEYQSRISFQDLVRASLRRVSSLCYFHGGGELQVDFRRLIQDAAAVRTVGSSLHWRKQERFSGRQHQWIDMSGVTGLVEYEAPIIDFWRPYWPFLLVSEYVHLGKGCVMGLGKIILENANQRSN